MGRTFIADPETILIILVICAVLFVIFNWSSDALQSSKESALEQQDTAMKCSTLNVEFVDRESNETHEIMYLQTNEPVEALIIDFRGSKNATEVIEKVEPNSIVKVSAKMKHISEVYAHVQGCDRIFG